MPRSPIRLELERAIRLSKEGYSAYIVEYEVSAGPYGAGVEISVPDYSGWRSGHQPVVYVQLDDEVYTSIQDSNDPNFYENQLLSAAARKIGEHMLWRTEPWHFNRYADVWEKSADIEKMF